MNYEYCLQMTNDQARDYHEGVCTWKCVLREIIFFILKYWYFFSRNLIICGTQWPNKANKKILFLVKNWQFVSKTNQISKRPFENLKSNIAFDVGWGKRKTVWMGWWSYSRRTVSPAGECVTEKNAFSLQNFVVWGCVGALCSPPIYPPQSSLFLY